MALNRIFRPLTWPSASDRQILTTPHQQQQQRKRKLRFGWILKAVFQPFRYECQYCSEMKRAHRFVTRRDVPSQCCAHLLKGNRVCRECMAKALHLQVQSRDFLDIGCPQCNTAWTKLAIVPLLSEDGFLAYRFLEQQDKKRRVYVPPEEFMPDPESMKVILDRGGRLCPWCRFPFVKSGGCNLLMCLAKDCKRVFEFREAYILGDANGQEASNVVRDENDSWQRIPG